MFIDQRLLLHGLGLAVTMVFPSGDIHKVLIITEGLAVLGLVLSAEMAAARFLAVHGIVDDELCQLEIIFQSIGLLQLWIELIGSAWNEDRFPELIFPLCCVPCRSIPT